MQTQAMFRVAIAGSLLWSSAACAQSEEQLTLDTAVALALQHNRQLRSSRIDVMKVGDRLAAARTQRLPQFSWYTLAAQRLTEVNFRFDQGVFGTYPGIGPNPWDGY